MTRASAHTLVSLDRWARYMGMNPVHFAGASAGNFFNSRSACDDIWVQHQWQNDEEMVSREELAFALATAEQDIANVLGFTVAPTWHVDELHEWTSGARQMTIQTKWGKVIAGGKRAVTILDNSAAVVYSDPDNDGWNELATITVALTDTVLPREIKVGFIGFDTDGAYEIRPLRKVAVSGNTATIEVDAWLMIDPVLYEAIPTTGVYAPIDVSTTSNYVTDVVVYREYNDTTQAQCDFYLPGISGSCGLCGSSGCSFCDNTTQSGCLAIVDSRFGKVLPYPAFYADGSWQYAQLEKMPRKIGLNYYAGEVSEQYRRGFTTYPIPYHLEEAVIWLATARLPKGVCGCANVKNRVADLQRDMAILRDNSAVYSRFERMAIFNNPFGIRNGEVKAWERVSKLIPDAVWSGGAI